MGWELETLVGFGMTILAGLMTGIICMWSVIRIGKGTPAKLPEPPGMEEFDG